MKTVLAWFAGTTGVMVLGGLIMWGIMTAIQLKQPVSVSVPATEAKEVKGAPTEGVTPKRPVRVFKGKKKELNLPDEVVKNEDKKVLAATQVKGSDRPQTITTVINTATGESESFVRQDALPWFAIETHGEARISTGYKYSLGDKPRPIVRLGVGYDVVRVKALTAGVLATVDSDGSAFAGVGVAYRW